jgi:hypothetical protein
MRYKRPEWVLVSCGELGVSICCFCHQTIINNKNWHSKAKAVGGAPHACGTGANTATANSA